MKTDGHYDVKAHRDGALRGQIRWLTCMHCAFRVDVRSLHRAGDRSGQGRYNRARAAMVKHLHAEHRGELAAGEGK